MVKFIIFPVTLLNHVVDEGSAGSTTHATSPICLTIKSFINYVAVAPPRRYNN